LKTFATLLCLALAAGNTLPLQAAAMTERDRERLIAHLQMTGSWLQDEVAHLSQAQLDYRPAPDKWTIAEVVQHLVIAEPGYWKLLQNGVSQPHAAGFKSRATDADVLWYGIDRTHRQKTSADENPRGQTIQVSEALAKFAQLRDTMLQYAKTTNDDLRAHDVREWNVDAYQWFLEISTHSQRHILQIREIKADPGFPKS
jgi:DinB superfamily